MKCLQQFYISILLLTFSATAVAVPTGVNWQWDNPKPQGNQLNALAIDEASDSIIAVGKLGTIFTSTDDGSNWAVQTSGTRNHLNNILLAPAAGLAYAVGDKGTILSSPSNNFSNWTANTTGLIGNINLTDISWNEDPDNSVFLVVGSIGNVLINDGSDTDWTKVSSQALSDAGNLTAVTWSPDLNLFVAVSQSGRVVSSSDGSNWTLQTYSTSTILRDVYWDDVSSLFIAVGNLGFIATSPDAINWTERTSNAGSSQLYGVIRQGSNLYVVGSSLLLTSNNGIDWSEVVSTTLTSNFKQGITADSTSILIAGAGAVLQRSTNNGADWTDLSPLSNVYNWTFTDIAWNGSDLFVAVGSASFTTLTSMDGLNWTTVSSGLTPNKLVWDGSRFVGVFTNGIYTSSDASSWSRNTISPLNGNVSTASDIAWDGTQYIAVGSSGYLITSPDAAFDNWTIQATGTSELLYAVNADGPLRLVVGTNATLLISTDASTWSAPASVPDISGRTLYDAAWSGSHYVVVGAVGTVLSSSDGNTWNDRSGFTFSNLRAVIWDGSQFVASDSAGGIYTSPDAITWTERDSVTANPLLSLAKGNGRLIAAGSNGTIISSNGSYSLGGTLSGLNGTLVLQNNSGDNLQLESNGNFVFPSEVNDGMPYAVTVLQPPSGQTCSVSAGSGVINAADVTDVSVSCTETIADDTPAEPAAGNTGGGGGGGGAFNLYLLLLLLPSLLACRRRV